LSRIFDGKPSTQQEFDHRTIPTLHGVKEWKVTTGVLPQNGASPEAHDWHKKRLFHEAVKSGNLKMVEIFLENGAPVNLKGRDRTSALHIAAYEGDVKMTQLLLKWGASTKKDGGLSTPEQASRNAEVTTTLRNHGKSSRGSKQSQKRDGSKLKSASSAPPPEYSAAP
jgi:ankyrin repeat protein